MAIKLCPNCGARINEKNLFCDYCGSMQVKEEPKKPKQPKKEEAPINQGNTVNVTFPVIPGKMLINCASIQAYVKGIQVYDGGFNIDTATFELSEPAKISIKISRWPDQVFTYPIEPGKNYELVLKPASSGWGFDVDFKQKIDKIKI